MRKNSRGLLFATVLAMLVTLLMSLGTITAANAAFLAQGAVNPANGFPLWYEDSKGLALQLCLDQNGNCILPPEFDPALAPVPPGVLPITAGPAALLTPTNFPVESFYWMAKVVGNLSVTQPNLTVTTAKVVLLFAQEAGFATLFTGAVVPGQQTTFLRINLQKMSGLVPNGSYTVTHPWGSFTFTADAAGNGGGVGGVFAGQTFRNQVGGAAPLDFISVMPGILAPVPGQAANVVMDNYLICDPAVQPAGYIGNPLAACTPAFKAGATIPQAVTFTGSGVAGQTFGSWFIQGKKFGMDINPPNKDFGPIVITAPTTPTIPSLPMTFTVTNVNAASAMNIGAITTTGANIADFTIIAAPVPAPPFTPCATGAVLPAAVAGTPSSCTVTVAFAPTALSPAPEVAVRTATLNIAATFAPPAGAPAGTLPTPVPPGLITLKGNAQFPVAVGVIDATKGAITSPAVTAKAADAGSIPTYTVTPLPKWEVKDVTVTDAAGVALTPTITRPTNPTNAVAVTAPAIASAQTITATFMPSGNLTGSGTLSVDDALKALKIYVGTVDPVGDDLAAIKVGPLDSTGRPAPVAGDVTPNLNDVVLILRRVLNIVTW